MANVFANYAFNFDEMNLSKALPNINTSTFGKDVTTSFNSQTYYDYYEVYWTEDGAQSRSFFGGYNFYTYYSTGAVAYGTAWGYLEFAIEGGVAVQKWGFEQSGFSMVDLYNAMLTPSTVDDLAVLAAGLQGNDTFQMSEFDDLARGFAGNDTMNGNGGNDTLSGGDGADTLNGGVGNDSLEGDAGDDTIVGGAGSDKMAGGTGADVFIFNSAAETYRGANVQTRVYDQISRFERLVDHIDVQAIDASTVLAGNNAFVWKGTGAISTSSAGEISVKTVNNAGTANDYTMVYFDTDRDASAEFQIKLTGLVSLTAGDFYL